MIFQDVIKMSVLAGKKILEIYNKDFSVYEKADSSPLTDADIASHEIILSMLADLYPNIPVLSEESTDINWSDRKRWSEYWLVDPLDGTKEFLNKNGEFTVNIAFIRNGFPVWGVVYVPSTNVLYYGGHETGSYKEHKGERVLLHVCSVKNENKNWVVVGSRSHQSEEFNKFVRYFDNPEVRNVGSSLKICMVAEGKADIYPRLGLTSEWDTAAAHAVLLGAGGLLIDANTKLPLQYNQKDTLLNPHFIAANGFSAVWR